MATRTTRRLIGTVLAAGAMTAATLTVAPAAAAAPLLAADPGNGIPGRYIVVLDKGLSASAVSKVAGNAGGKVHYVYTSALNGFAASLPSAAVTALRHNKHVSYIEQDQWITINADQPNPPSWGLDRIDQRNLPLNQNYHYDQTGAGVKAYIIDTGLRLTHNDFGGRAISGYDAIDGGSADDCNGHGTHVAGTAGGASYGVAKGVTLVAVRVLNCSGSGTNSQVIAGINWVTSDHQAGQPAVANMSLGGAANSSIDTAVRNSIVDGISYSIAAGNESTLACNRSPARVAEGITVGATTTSDARASYSNYGTCLDIFAPGSSITSAWHNSNTATNTISGTSMAAPHVTGAAALYLQTNSGATPQQVRDQLVNTATTGVVTNPGSGSPNRLLYTLGGVSPPPPPPPPPPAACSGFQQTFTGSLSGAGDTDYHPSPYYYSSVSGAHKGCLDGPAGVDFDLYLQKWNGWFWADVASGTSSLPDENVTYNGTAGYYRWEVYSYSGSGSYTFGMSKP